jgi:hypothetical protein
MTSAVDLFKASHLRDAYFIILGKLDDSTEFAVFLGILDDKQLHLLRASSLMPQVGPVLGCLFPQFV